MIKSPKEKFQSSQIRTGQWGNIVTNPIFDEACDAALLEMIETMPYVSLTAQGDVECRHQLVGAQSIIKILKKLHEITTEEPKKTNPQRLNYQAGV